MKLTAKFEYDGQRPKQIARDVPRPSVIDIDTRRHIATTNMSILNEQTKN